MIEELNLLAEKQGILDTKRGELNQEIRTTFELLVPLREQLNIVFTKMKEFKALEHEYTALSKETRVSIDSNLQTVNDELVKTNQLLTEAGDMIKNSLPIELSVPVKVSTKTTPVIEQTVATPEKQQEDVTLQSFLNQAWKDSEQEAVSEEKEAEAEPVPLDLSALSGFLRPSEKETAKESQAVTVEPAKEEKPVTEPEPEVIVKENHYNDDVLLHYIESHVEEFQTASDEQSVLACLNIDPAIAKTHRALSRELDYPGITSVSLEFLETKENQESIIRVNGLGAIFPFKIALVAVFDRNEMAVIQKIRNAVFANERGITPEEEAAVEVDDISFADLEELA